MEDGLGLNIQDGSKHDKYISYWLYYYTYLNTIGRADKRKQTMSVLFDDETDSPKRLEDTMNYLEPVLHNVRMITSGNSDRINWTGDKLPINDIQRYKLSDKRKMRDWLCFPAISRRYGNVKANNPYLQLSNRTGIIYKDSRTIFAFHKMLEDYFSTTNPIIKTQERKTFLHPSFDSNSRDSHSGLNQNILSQKKTISSEFLEWYKNKILAIGYLDRPNSGVVRYHDSFSKYFTLDSFLDFFKPEVYQGGNLDEVDSEDAKNKLKQAKQILKGMRKKMREIHNQFEGHKKNIEEILRQTIWITDGRRIKGQEQQLNAIIEVIYNLDKEMCEEFKNARNEYIAKITRILKKMGYNEKQIYQFKYKLFADQRIKRKMNIFDYITNKVIAGKPNQVTYESRNHTLIKYLNKLKRGYGVADVKEDFTEKDGFSYWRNDIIAEFETTIRHFTELLLRKIIPCKSILVNEGRTKLPSALSLYSKSDAYVSLEGLKKYASLRIVGHKYYKVFQGGWESYMKSLKEVKDYDRILITPMLEFKSGDDLGRSIIFIPAGMKVISNAWRSPIALQYIRSDWQNDMEKVIFDSHNLGEMQYQLESIYNNIIKKTKNPFTKRKQMTEREERMMDWSILEIRLKANEDLGFLNW